VDPILAVPVDYQPSIESSRIDCLISGSRASIGALSSGITYKVKYIQAGKEYPAEYPVLVLAKPRILGVRSRLVTQSEQIVVEGIGFNTQISYLCQFVENTEVEDGYQDPAHQESFKGRFVPAILIEPMSVTCPSIAEAASYVSTGGDYGYRCLEVRLKDEVAGSLFRVEPGSPAEAAATSCWVTDINRLIAPGQAEPRRLPLISSGGASLPGSSRVISISLSAGSPILGLLAKLGAPLGGVTLRFSNVVISAGGTPKQLRADVADLTSPTLHDAACAM
jgi:hypothetical protein